MKNSPTLALQVCQGLASHVKTASAYGREYGIDVKEISLWKALYRHHGPTVFIESRDFSLEEILAIVRDKEENGLTLAQTCVKYKILVRSTLRNWVRLYKKGRLQDMRHKNKPTTGTPSMQRTDRERIKMLERELLLAKAEIAYLKKLRALMQGTEGQPLG